MLNRTSIKPKYADNGESEWPNTGLLLHINYKAVRRTVKRLNLSVKKRTGVTRFR